MFQAKRCLTLVLPVCLLQSGLSQVISCRRDHPWLLSCWEHCCCEG